MTGKVGPLEGLWWHAGGTTDLDAILSGYRSDWRWTLMIVTPDKATEEEVAEQFGGRADEGRACAIGSSLRIEQFAEGDVAQVRHLGPYSEERPSIERLHAGIAEAGFPERGKHHETHLGDPRRSAPSDSGRSSGEQPAQNGRPNAWHRNRMNGVAAEQVRANKETKSSRVAVRSSNIAKAK